MSIESMSFPPEAEPPLAETTVFGLRWHSPKSAVALCEGGLESPDFDIPIFDIAHVYWILQFVLASLSAVALRSDSEGWAKAEITR